jgi:hypothetical protein
MRKYENVTLHQDSAALTYHASCHVPAIVPVYWNFQEAEGSSIGRAVLRRNAETGTIVGDFFLDGQHEQGNFIIGAKGTKIMEHEGTNYVMYGEIGSVSLVSPDAAAKLTSEDEPAPTPTAI